MITLTHSETTIQSPPVQITARDKRYLERMIDHMELERDNLARLVAKLDQAEVVKSEFIPRNVVTMNSKVSIIDMDTSERLGYTLVFPLKANPNKHQVSVTSPIGYGMFGYQTGDEFEADNRRFIIAKVDYQPDAANHYRL